MAELEYIVDTESGTEMEWMIWLLQELSLAQENDMVHWDSHCAMHLSENATLYSQTKHIDVQAIDTIGEDSH